MKIMEREEMLIEQGIEQGMRQGRLERDLELVRSKLAKGQTTEQIAADLLVSPAYIEELLEMQ